MLGIVSTLTCSPSAATEALFSRPAPATEQLLLGIEGELEALLTGAATGRQDRNRAPTVGTGRTAEVSKIVKRSRRCPWTHLLASLHPPRSSGRRRRCFAASGPRQCPGPDDLAGKRTAQLDSRGFPRALVVGVGRDRSLYRPEFRLLTRWDGLVDLESRPWARRGRARRGRPARLSRHRRRSEERR